MHTITIEQKKTYPRGRGWVRDMVAGSFLDVKLARGVQQGPVCLKVAEGLYQFKSTDGDAGYYLVNGTVTRIGRTVAYEVKRDLDAHLAGKPVPPEPVTDGLVIKLLGRFKVWAARIEGFEDGRFDWVFLRASDGGKGWRRYAFLHDGIYVTQDQMGRRYWQVSDGSKTEIGEEVAKTAMDGDYCPF